jgi:hypothetical protein
MDDEATEEIDPFGEEAPDVHNAMQKIPSAVVAAVKPPEAPQIRSQPSQDLVETRQAMETASNIDFTSRAQYL